MRFGVLAFLAACGGTDADYDGFPAADDCDDTDAFVYPGAPEHAGNGIDEDCDGADPLFAIVGSWDLVWIEAIYFGVIPLFDDPNAEGGLTVEENLDASLDVAATLNPYLTYGIPLPIELTMPGITSPAPGEGAFVVFAEQTAYGYPVHADLDCVILDDGARLSCRGELLAFSLGFDTVAEFDRR